MKPHNNRNFTSSNFLLKMNIEKRIVCRRQEDGLLTLLLTDKEVSMLLKAEKEYPEMDLMGHLIKMNEYLGRPIELDF